MKPEREMRPTGDKERGCASAVLARALCINPQATQTFNIYIYLTTICLSTYISALLYPHRQSTFKCPNQRLSRCERNGDRHPRRLTNCHISPGAAGRVQSGTIMMSHHEKCRHPGCHHRDCRFSPVSFVIRGSAGVPTGACHHFQQLPLPLRSCDYSTLRDVESGSHVIRVKVGLGLTADRRRKITSKGKSTELFPNAAEAGC